MKLDGDFPKGKNSMVIAGAIIVFICTLLFLIDIAITREIIKNQSNSPPAWVLITKSIIDNAIAGALLAFVLALFYRSIIKIVDHERVIEVNPGDIGTRLVRNARVTNRYIFIGNTATFLSSSILPIICDNLKEKKGTITTKIFVIDPRDNASIDAYVAHKMRVKFSNAGVSNRSMACWTRPAFDWGIETKEQTLSKIYACLYFCAYASKCSGIEINVFLRKSFTAFRADMSDTEVILTQESKSEPAVAFSFKGDFYNWHFKESESLEQQCEKVALSNNSKLMGLYLAHPSSPRDKLEESLSMLILDVFSDKKFSLDPSVMNLTIDRIISPTHSYQ